MLKWMGIIHLLGVVMVEMLDNPMDAVVVAP
jgi:hypothetical protein